jgi:hypothetical protein
MDGVFRGMDAAEDGEPIIPKIEVMDRLRLSVGE